MPKTYLESSENGLYIDSSNGKYVDGLGNRINAMEVTGQPISEEMRIIGALVKKNGGQLTIPLGDRLNISPTLVKYGNQERVLLVLVWRVFKRIHSGSVFLTFEDLSSVKGIIINCDIGDMELNAN